MKMRSAQKVHYDAGPNMTPLVDVVMVILIFLMLTGSFAVGTHYLKSNIPIRPQGGVGTSNKSLTDIDEPLLVRVDSVMLADEHSAGAWVASADSLRSDNDPEDLTAKLAGLRMKLNAANKPTDKIQVVISPGKGTAYRHLIEVYEAALRAEFTKVAFSQAH